MVITTHRFLSIAQREVTTSRLPVVDLANPLFLTRRRRESSFVVINNNNYCCYCCCYYCCVVVAVVVVDVIVKDDEEKELQKNGVHPLPGYLIARIIPATTESMY